MYVKLDKSSDLDGFRELLKNNTNENKAELLKKAQNRSITFLRRQCLAVF